MDNHPYFFLPSFAKSPLGGARHGFSESLLLFENSFVPTFDLRTVNISQVAETLGIGLPQGVGQSESTLHKSGNELHALCLGPDEWIIFGNMDAVRILEPLRATTHFSIVDVSAQRTHIEIQGPNARRVLEHLWEQDLRENRFSLGSCSQGLMVKAPTILWHRDVNRYHISVRSSFALHLWTALVDASIEYLEQSLARCPPA